MDLQTHKGFGMTRREYEMYRAKAIVRHDIETNQQKFRQQITDADVAYMVKALEAPDVNLFVDVM